MKNFFARLGFYALMALMAIPFVGTHIAKAAEDAILTTGKASTTAWLSDNGAVIGGWLVAVFLFVIGIVVLIGLLTRSRRQIGGAVGGGKRRR